MRHGETSSYRFDAGLTTTGVRQSEQRGERIAAGCPADAAVVFAYAPTERARSTAQAMHRRFVAESARLGRSPLVAGPIEDRRFANLAVRVEGRMLEPTQARALIGADHGGPPAARTPGWVVEAQRFWGEHEAQGDAMGFWLHTPLVWHESPAAVVCRILGAAVACAEQMPETDVLVVASHSGCLRAVVAWAAGLDPGEPDNAEEVVIRVDPGEEELTIAFRDGSWLLQRPPTAWSVV